MLETVVRSVCDGVRVQRRRLNAMHATTREGKGGDCDAAFQFCVFTIKCWASTSPRCRNEIREVATYL